MRIVLPPDGRAVRYVAEHPLTDGCDECEDIAGAAADSGIALQLVPAPVVCVDGGRLCLRCFQECRFPRD